MCARGMPTTCNLAEVIIQLGMLGKDALLMKQINCCCDVNGDTNGDSRARRNRAQPGALKEKVSEALVMFLTQRKCSVETAWKCM